MTTRRHRVHRPIPRVPACEQGAGRRPARLPERATRACGSRRRATVQTHPLGAAQAPRGPHRHPATAAGGDQTRRRRSEVWRAYQLKEALRAIFDPDLTPTEAARLLDRFVPGRSGLGCRRSSSCSAPSEASRWDPGRARARDQTTAAPRASTARPALRPAARSGFTPPTPSRPRGHDHAVLRSRRTATPARRAITTSDRYSVQETQEKGDDPGRLRRRGTRRSDRSAPPSGPRRPAHRRPTRFERR
jgi:hypothetical protein